MNQCPHTILLTFPDDHGTPTISCALAAGHEGQHIMFYRQPFYVDNGKRGVYEETVLRIEWEPSEKA